MYNRIIFIIIVCLGVSCTDNSNNEFKVPQKSWESIRSNPSLTLDPSANRKIINHDIVIEEDDFIPINDKSFNGDLIFDDGSLTIQNTEMDLTPKNSIRFIDDPGSIFIKESKLSALFIENANILLKGKTELHLYSNNPLEKSDLIVEENGKVSIYFYGLNINNIKMCIKSDMENFYGKKVEIKSFDNGICLTIK